MYGDIVLVNKKVIPENLSDYLIQLLRKANDSLSVKRIQCVYFKAKYDKTPEEIADMVGYNVAYVKQIQAIFWKYGESALDIKPRGGRRRENLKFKEEKELIDKFNKGAEKGGIIEVSKIKAAYESKIGKKVAKSTVYRMLKRHDWRKIAPRTKHPKSDKEALENFKKTSQEQSRKPLKKLRKEKNLLE